MFTQPATAYSSPPAFFNDTLSRTVLNSPPPFTIASDVQTLTHGAFVAVNGLQPETIQQLSA